MIGEGTYKPPEAKLWLTHAVNSNFPIRTVIQRVEQFAGAAIGNALIAYPANLADNPTPHMGQAARIEVGNTTIFRGCVAHGPIAIDAGQDDLELVLVDDKFLLQAKIVGMPGIGNVPDAGGAQGFTDVGFDIVFNRDGKPNKHPSNLMFNTGSTAVLWTLKDILQFVFAYYVPATVATADVDTECVGAAWAKNPSHVDLCGQTALQAVDTIVQLAGESWALIPGSNKSTFKSVRAGAGTERKVQLFRPWQKAKATGANEESASEVNIAATIEKCKDKWLAVSGNTIKDTTYSTTDNFLVEDTSFADKEYSIRFKVSLTGYSAHGLGQNLSAGSKPKPWMKNLCTRYDAGDYLTAEEITGDPTRLFCAQPEHFLWVAADGVAANAKLVTGGYRIDCQNGTIDFKDVLDIAPVGSGAEPGKLNVTDPDNGQSWADAEIWLTIATDIGNPVSATATGATYLDTVMYGIIKKPDLRPELRQNVYLPDLTDADPHKVSIAAADSEETYRDVSTELQTAADSALASTPKIETPIEVTMPFFPLWDIGDRLSISGRNLGATGDEVIIAIHYDIYESHDVRISAGNVMGAVDTDRFVRAKG